MFRGKGKILSEREFEDSLAEEVSDDEVRSWKKGREKKRE